MPGKQAGSAMAGIVFAAHRVRTLTPRTVHADVQVDTKPQKLPAPVSGDVRVMSAISGMDLLPLYVWVLSVQVVPHWDIDFPL